RRARRARQALEVALVDDGDVGVEAGEPDAGAGAVDEGADPAQGAEVLQHPDVGDQAGRGAERDHVGDAVELRAELALRVGPARDAPVHAVEDQGDEDRDRADFEALVHRLHDGEEAAEQHAGGEEVRQQVDAAPAQAAEPGVRRHVVVPRVRRVLLYRVFELGVFSHASTLVAAYTFSPIAALACASRGRYRSTREPKRMNPNRCPRTTRAPGST